jgi:hypothetical protein
MALVLAISSVWAGGCGTISNLASSDPKAPFGGVEADLDYWSRHPLCSDPNSRCSSQNASIGLLAIFPAELTLSAIGDTLTWPLALYLIKKKQGYHFDDSESEDTANPPPPSSGKVFSSAIVDEQGL